MPDRFDANDAAHQAFRRTVYNLLGGTDPALDAGPVIELDTIDLTDHADTLAEVNG